MPKFEIDDIVTVQLLDVAPNMLVINIDYPAVYCMWFTRDGLYQVQAFDEKLLMKALPEVRVSVDML